MRSKGGRRNTEESELYEARRQRCTLCWQKGLSLSTRRLARPSSFVVLFRYTARMKVTPTLLPLALLLTFGCSAGESEAALATDSPPAKSAEASSEPAAEAATASTYDGVSIASIQSAGVDEVMSIRKTLLSDTTELLKGVTDADGAKAASGALDGIVSRLGPLSQRQGELENGSMVEKASYAKAALDMLGDATGLSAEIARVTEIPGVTEYLQSGIDAVVAYFMPGK